jgi:hypothetical protein
MKLRQRCALQRLALAKQPAAAPAGYYYAGKLNRGCLDMNEKAGGGSGGGQPIYLRQWISHSVAVITAIQTKHSGVLSNIVFDEKRLMYIVLDDRTILNFDHVVEVRLEP